MIRILAIFSIIIVGLSPVYSQVPNYQIYNYTVDDGLPSNECHDVVQDSLGYIWIATDRGLVKWDGYDFKVYGIRDGLSDMSCLSLFLDANQDIWINTLSGTFFLYIHARDSIVSYKYNELLELEVAKRYLFNNFAVSKDGDLVASMDHFKVVKITDKGNLTTIYEGPGSHFVVIKLSDGVFISRFNPEEDRSEDAQIYITALEDTSVILERPLIEYNVNKEAKRGGRYTGNIINDELMVFCLAGFTYFVQHDTLVDYRRSIVSYNHMVADGEGGYFSAERWLKGVKHYAALSDLINYRYTTLLSDVSATRLLIDRDGNLWATTTNSGLFYLKKTTVEQINTSQIIDMVMHGDTLYTVEEDNTFKKYNHLFRNYELHSFDQEITSLSLNISKSAIVIAGAVSGYFNLDSGLLKKVPTASSYGTYGLLDGSTFLWGNTAFALLSSNGDSLQNMEFEDRLRHRVTDVVVSNGNKIYVSTIEGLFHLTQESLVKNVLDSTNAKIRINALLRNKDVLALATTGRGVIFWDEQEIVKILDESDGLISNSVESIIEGGCNQLVATTKSGLSVLNYNDEIGTYEVLKNYDSRLGLPSNEITQVIAKNDSLIVATDKGLAIIHEEFVPASSISTIIEDIAVSGVSHEELDNLEFAHHQNSIDLAYKTIDFGQHGQIGYRYNLNNDGWRETSNTSVAFNSLQPGNYKFEVQAQNVDGVWGPSTFVPFLISPPWWQTYWFYTLVILGASFGVYSIYKLRVGAIIKDAKIKEELRQLEMSALQAQMNPHFIFNCLNSIQRFIMSNDKKSAMSYLSKFAKLVRQTLNSSVEKSVTLEAEVDMLENYLSLEQLRHKNKFTYSINVEEGIDQIATRIPPLLIQPFVENAVLHGMKRMENGGEIKISFNQSIDGLIIEVRDNGKGVTERENTAIHKSLGTSITTRRLALLNLQQSGGVTIQPLHSEAGTFVQLILKNT